MFLAIDIGNSSICLGLFDHGNDKTTTLRTTAKLSADTKRTSDEYAVIIRALLAAQGISTDAVTAAMLSSVVPRLTHSITEALSPIPTYTVGGGVKTGIGLRVDDPSQLGADIVTNASAAVKLYGAPVLVVDIGTATVISAIDSQKSLIGVAIAPGPASAQEGLHASAALIPYAELNKPQQPLGKNTPSALQSGIVMGHACMVDGMLQRILETYGFPPDTPVVVTGGLAPMVTPQCRHKLTYQKDLTLWGLYHIYTATHANKHKRS